MASMLVVALVAGSLCAACAGDWSDTEPLRARAVDADVPREARQRGAEDYAAGIEPEAVPVPGAAVGWDRQRLWSRRVDWEPVVAADPASDRVYQMTTRYFASPCMDCPDPIVVFRRSEDGGATWREDAFPFLDGRALNDPQLAVADDGTVFAVWLEDYRPGVRFARSQDHGDTWTVAEVFTGERQPRWSDHPLLLHSDDGRDVYVAFSNGDSWIVASHDGGRTFSPSQRTNPGGRYWFHTGGTVAPDGVVYMAAADYSDSFEGLTHVNVLRSVDRGATWTTTRIDSSAQAPRCDWSEGCYEGFLGPRADVAVDAAGRLMLVYNAGVRDGRPQSLWYRTSEDGVTWSGRRRFPRASPRIGFAFPVVEAGPAAGDFRVVWVDDRRWPRRWWNTWLRATTDGGETWMPRVRLSGGGPETAYSHAGGYDFPYGDYLGLAVDASGRNHVIWGAGESFDGNGGAWYTRGR